MGTLPVEPARFQQSMGFLAGAAVLATIGADVDGSIEDRLRVWDLRDDALAAVACAVAHRNLTRSEWARFVGPAARFQRVCP
jgi:hypothetical protein